MQKLVKKTLHYETIMPVEAYHPEDDDWETEIGLVLTIGGMAATVLGFPGVGLLLGGAAIANTIVHDEQSMETLNHVAFAEEEAYRLAGESMVQEAQEASEAIMEGIIDFVSDIDLDDPIVQQYGE